MKNNPLLGLFLAATLFLAPACTTYVFSSPVTLSTKSVEAPRMTPVGEVSTEYTNLFLLIIPFSPDPRTPYDRLLEEAKALGGDAVVDVQLRSKSFFYMLLFLFDTWELTGTAVKMS